MTIAELRRSRRAFSVAWNSNGRMCMEDHLGFSREELEAWLTSPNVHPHLVLWYNTCVRRGWRFNEAISWIKDEEVEIEEEKYFYDGNKLEEDLLLECLGQGDISEDSVTSLNSITYADYADENARTHLWPTQDLRARAAWRIVQDNSGKGQIFQSAKIFHPAKAYGVTIELLLIAFHSIAHRKSGSIWAELITCSPVSQPQSPSMFKGLATNGDARAQMALDADQEDFNEDVYHNELDEELETIYESDVESAALESSTLSDGESDFIEFETPKNKKFKTSPKEPTKKRARQLNDDEESPSKKVKQWVASLPSKDTHDQDIDNMLHIFDEEGEPITGYRRAPKVQLLTPEQSLSEEVLVMDEDVVVLRKEPVVWAPLVMNEVVDKRVVDSAGNSEDPFN